MVAFGQPHSHYSDDDDDDDDDNNDNYNNDDDDDDDDDKKRRRRRRRRRRIVFEGAIREIYNLLTPPRTVCNTYALCPGAVVCKSRAAHRTLIACNM